MVFLRLKDISPFEQEDTDLVKILKAPVKPEHFEVQQGVLLHTKYYFTESLLKLDLVWSFLRNYSTFFLVIIMNH